MKYINIAYLIVTFNFLVGTQPIPRNIDIVEKSKLISSTFEISIRDCDEYENDYTAYGSECCDTA